MTDQEMIERCAKALGILENSAGYCADIATGHLSGIDYPFDPLHDDAQAMALVKKFNLECFRPGRRSGFEAIDDYWLIGYDAGAGVISAQGDDINRTIVECVAKMHESGPT